MMKRILALLLALTLCMTVLPVLAETTDDTTADDTTDTGTAINPYTIEGLGAVIELPDAVTVTKEDSSETAINLTLALDGRSDVGLNLSLTYNEGYAGYTMLDLPDEMKQELLNYYAENYTCSVAPAWPEVDESDEYAFVQPLVIGGTGADGNMYVMFIMIMNGYVLNVSGGIAATEFDTDSYGTIFNLYWQAVQMFMDNIVPSEE